MKKLLALLLALMLTLGCGVVLAEETVEDTEPLTLDFENFEVGENVIEIFANTNAGISPDFSQLSVLLSGNELVGQSVTGLADTDKATTHLFLVDVSGSISDRKMEEIKEIITAYVAGINPVDNVSVMRVGTELYTEPFVNADSVEAQIEALVPEDKETNLYAATVQAVNILQTDANVHKSRVLTVISDGEEYAPMGYTLEEAQDIIEESDIKVNTVAMLDSGASAQEIEDSKILGSFARVSAGGSDITSGISDVTAEDVTGQLIASWKNTFVVACSIEGFSAPTDETLLEMSLTVDGFATATDSKMLTASSVMQGVVATPTPEPTEQPADPSMQPETSEDPIDTSSPEESGTPGQEGEQQGIMGFLLGIFGGNEMLMWIVVAAVGVLIVGGIILIIVLSGKKKKKQIAMQQKAKQQSAVAKPSAKPPVAGQAAPVNSAQGAKTTSPNVGATVAAQSAPVQNRAKYRITLTKIGQGKTQAFTRDITTELVIGRAGNVDVSIPNDDVLSSRHCRIFERENMLFLEDLGSTNGTYLNGVPVQDIEKLNADDIILLGSMEVRLEWQVL